MGTSISNSDQRTRTARRRGGNDGAEEPTELILFELWLHGHSPNFLRIILEHWRDHGPGVVRVVVRRRFVEEFVHVFDGFENVCGSPVRWIALDPEDDAHLELARERASLTVGRSDPDGESFLSKDLLWRLLEKYFKRFPAKHILLMNLEELLLPLASGKHTPAPFSGIVFTPAFHYRKETEGASFRIQAYVAVQERLVRRVLTHPDARTVFFLDQAVLPRFQGKYSAQIAYLPDPVRLPTSAPTEASLAETRRRFGIPHDRKLFLMFGDLRARKGVWKLCAALHHLTRQELASICVAFVGHADPLIEERLRAQIAALADQPIVLVREPAYVSDAVRDQWFEIADVVLAPYILHTGSSGVLMLAAAHRRPSISQDFGQMGRLTDDFRLGVTADTRDPEDLARALRAYLGPEPPPGWDAEVAYEFARSQSCERFARALVDPLRPFMT